MKEMCDGRKNIYVDNSWLENQCNKAAFLKSFFKTALLVEPLKM
jgi:hypothetical protein